jgi:hypothetical protein
MVLVPPNVSVSVNTAALAVAGVNASTAARPSAPTANFPSNLIKPPLEQNIRPRVRVDRTPNSKKCSTS